MPDRLLEITSNNVFGDSAIVLSFSGREEISQPFEFFVDLVSRNLELKPKDVIGQALSIRLERGKSASGADLDPRFFHGYVSHLWIGGMNVVDDGKLKYRSYRIRLSPWTWFMTRAARCYIYLPEKEQKTLDDVFKKLLERVDSYKHVKTWHSDGNAKILKSRKVEHCVQYRETDFNFLSRTLEQYGVHYFFKHDKEDHKLMLCDNVNYPKAIEAEVDFPKTSGHRLMDDHITHWERTYEFVSGRYEHTDYDFMNPSTDLKVGKDKEERVDSGLSNNSGYELYDFPGEFTEPGDGDHESLVRIQEEEARFDTVVATSNCKTFSAGHCFKLKSHPDAPDQDGQERLITRITHSASQPGPFNDTGSGANYSNHFECVPKSIHFRPRRVTPKPIISGIQTATVAGPSADEIHTDAEGRIKVHFHWDREGRKDRFSTGDKISCWVRVAYPSAGKSWGFVSIPRVGQEVIVEFIEGDPDRPVVTGCIYNGEQKQHYPLPDNKTRSYWKTNSSKGGDGYNELMFEDKAGEERVFLHAQKDMDLRALNDTKQITLHNQHQIVGTEKGKNDGGDLSQLVWRDKNTIVKRDHQEHIEGNIKQLVGKGDASDGGTVDIVIEKKEVKKIGQEGKHLTVEGDSNTKVAGGFSVDAGGDMHLKIGGQLQIESGAAGQTHIKAGTVLIEAMQQLSLKVGGNFIDINMAGIFIQGMMLNLNSGGAPAPPQPCQPVGPKEAEEAAPGEAAAAWDSKTGNKSRP